LAWKDIGFTQLLLAPSQLLDFDRTPSEYLGILPHFPIMLGGNYFMVNMIVVNGLLQFNILLQCDYVYAMINVVVSTLFQMMCFPHNRRIVTIDQLSSNNQHPSSQLYRDIPSYVPTIRVDTTLPWVNYVASYPKCSFSSETYHFHSFSTSWDMVPIIYQGILLASVDTS